MSWNERYWTRNTPVVRKLTLANTPVLLVSPLANHDLIVSGWIISTNRNVGAGETVVSIYEGATNVTGTIDRLIFQAELPASVNPPPATGLNIITTAGKHILVKVSDTDVCITLLYYHTPV